MQQYAVIYAFICIRMVRNFINIYIMIDLQAMVACSDCLC
jgi:hypothetical protein